MNIIDAISVLENEVPDPSKGLPDELFYYISKTTPLINVDLLIKDENGRTLLSWRDDKFCGKGWHVPGGIIRFKESMETRVRKVAEMEIGVDIEFDSEPIDIKQCIHHEREVRSHLISILYKCHLPSTFVPKNKDLSELDIGYLKWHDGCPDNLLKVHEMYREYV